jgi:opacity protein-like surface antigen
VLRTTIATILMMTLPVAAAHAGDSGKGLYILGGAALGWANVDDDYVGASVSNSTNWGFNLAAGLRFSDLLAAEAQVTYLTAGDVSLFGTTIPGVGTSAVVSTVDAKLYPLALFGSDASSRLQPYARAGIGGGWGDLSGALAGEFEGSEGTFVARFGAGLDFYLTDNLGLYGDFSYYVTTKDLIVGVGAISFGGIVRF